jgi:hypothetical protein
MKDWITTEELFTKLNEEKKTGELLPLDLEIYKNTENAENKEQSENAAKQQENRAKIITALRSKRTQKILTYIAYGRHLPKPIPEEEERLYIRIKKIIEEENGGQKTTKIRITADTPELRTPEGRKLGPFDKNTLVEIENQQDLEFLIRNKIGETTN